jgi:hypothetical protein
VATLSLAAFGGPVLTVFRSPLILIVAVVVWTALFAGGQALGDRVVAPRLAERDLSRFKPGS